MCRPDSRPRRRPLLLLPALAVVLALPAAAAPSPDLVVTLKFIPTEPEEVLEQRGVVAVGGGPFEILVVSDGRPDKDDVIGRNIEKGANVPIRARTPVTSWLTQVLSSSFAGWGTPSTPGAGLVVEPELIKLFVVEEHTYKAEVTMKFRLKRRDGTEIWAGIVGGAASRFGRSLKEENYQEVLSDALLSCISKFWADPGFRETWAKGASPEPPAPSPTPSQTLSPEAAKAKLLELQGAGFDEETLVSWIRRVTFTRALTADDLIDWRSSGVPQAAIKAALE